MDTSRSRLALAALGLALFIGGAWVFTSHGPSAPDETETADGPLVPVAAPAVAPPTLASRPGAAQPARGARVDGDDPNAASGAKEPADAGAAAQSSDGKPHAHVRVTRDGQALAGAEVRLVRRGDARVEADAVDSFFASPPIADAARRAVTRALSSDLLAATGADGRLDLAIGPGRYDAVVLGRDGADRLFGVARFNASGSDAVDVSVELQRGVEIRGVVLDRKSGDAVPNIEVQAWALRDARIEHATDRLRTDAEGRFTLLAFEREPYVVRVFGSVPSMFGFHGSPTATLPPRKAEVRTTEVAAPADGLDNVEIRVDSVETLRLHLFGRAITGHGIRDFGPTPAEPGVWIASGEWGSDDKPPLDPAYVEVAQGTGCPWYCLRLRGAGPVVTTRMPGGLRDVALSPARTVSGTAPKEGRGRVVRGFVRAGEGERVEFAAVALPDDGWTLTECPTDAFDLAVYEGSTRVGPWRTVSPGLAELTDVALSADASSK